VIGKLSIPILGQGDPNRPKDIHLVGRYALGIDWTDGHGSIYPFEFLRRACPCSACAELEGKGETLPGLPRPVEAPPATALWPSELKKLDGGLRVVWADAHESFMPWADLRASCRCASCTGAH
jgi:hypothetical protein